jgi:hypothetical protein
MRQGWFALIMAVVWSSVHSDESATVHINWTYKDFPAKVELYGVKGHPRLWETKSVKSLDHAPVVARLESSDFRLGPGDRVRFALVVRNDTDKPLYFFAAPHQAHPVEHSLGFKFKCLCVNHAFVVAPRETWYRVVELSLSEAFVGSELTITHTILGIDEVRARAFSRPSGMSDM